MGNQKSEDRIWNKNQMKSNDMDEIKNKINLQKIKKIIKIKIIRITLYKKDKWKEACILCQKEDREK